MSNCLDSIDVTLRSCKTEQDWEILARKVFRQTFVPIDVDENTTPETFHVACTGNKLRFEMIGVVLVYYVMGALVADVDQLELSGKNDGQYLLELTRASNLCVSFCDRTESLNDVLLWLLHANVILLTFQYGDASETILQILPRQHANPPRSHGLETNWRSIFDCIRTRYTSRTWT